eukprot:2696681-Alexandrium_andersonii.AAC.1
MTSNYSGTLTPEQGLEFLLEDLQASKRNIGLGAFPQPTCDYNRACKMIALVYKGRMRPQHF